MEDEKRLVPRIRFPEFTDDWEQRKSGDISPLRGGFAFKSNEYRSEGVPIVRISNILSDGSVGADFAYYDEQNSDEAYALYDGAAVLAMSGATTGKVSVLHAEKGQKYYQNQRVGYFVPTDNCDYVFVRTIMKSQLFVDQLSAVLVAGAQPNVSSKEIDGFEFMVPKSKDEQRKIGVFFENLDNLITLHQRECDTYKKMKKGMMQKLFNQEVRFKKDDGSDYADWDSVRLGDCLSEVVEKIDFDDENNENLLSSTVTGVYRKKEYFSNDKHQDTHGYKVLRKNQLVMSPQNLWMGNINVNTSYDFGYVSPSYKIFEFTDKLNITYAKNLLKTQDMKYQYLLVSEQGASVVRRNTNMDAFMEIDLYLPADIEEQTKIANCLAEFDNLIDASERRLEAYKLLKKAMLQKMFV